MSSTAEKKRKIEKASDEMYVYTGNGKIVPKDVVSVRFNPSVIEVEEKAFQNCNKLEAVVLNDVLTEIGESAFSDCIVLQSVVIPSTVTKIGKFAFISCFSLAEVVLNEGLKKIGYRAFSHCHRLQRITIPSSVLEIRPEAFISCNCLREVVLNDGLKKMGKYVFHECKRLECISIPSTVVEIGNYAFSGCSNLREVVIHNNEGTQIRGNAFENCSSLERFKFPRLSTRLENIIQAGKRDIEAKMDDIPAVEWRGGELIIPAIHQQICTPSLINWGMGGVDTTLVGVDKEKLATVEKLIAYYEVKEATTLFELALWKAAIYQVDNDDNIDRVAHRIEVPGPVKDTILQYLR